MQTLTLKKRWKQGFFTDSMRFFWAVVLIYAVVLTLFRIALGLSFFSVFSTLSVYEWFYSSYMGARFDIRLAIVFLFPLLVMMLIPPLNPWKLSAHKKWQNAIQAIWTGWFLIQAFVVSMFYILDAGNFAYLKKRVDYLIVSLGKDQDIAMHTVWENYPVITIAIGLSLWMLFLGFIFYRALQRTVLFSESHPSLPWGWKMKVGATVINLFILWVGFYGNPLRTYGLRWSDAHYSTNPFAVQLALNPVHNFIDSAKQNELVADAEKTRKSYPIVQTLLQPDNPDSHNLQYLRHRQVTGHPALITPPPKPLNIVVVIYESFSAHRSSIFNNPLDPSPFMKKLADEGILFARAFTSSNGTQRGVFSLMTGIPDVHIAESSMRLPKAASQHIVMSDFSGYEKYYFVGSSAAWGNINAVFNNVPNIHIYDQDNLPEKSDTYWGIPDHRLFNAANTILTKEHSTPDSKPFIAVIQSVSNHEPWTWPKDVEDRFRPKTSAEVTHQMLEDAGFFSLDLYNTYRYADFSVETFIEKAKKEPYFDDTIFVFIGDEGSVSPAPTVMSKEWQVPEFRWNIRHTPFIVYAPKYVRPRVIDYPVAQIDVLPTVAGLAGVKYRNTTLGRDAFQEINPDKAMVFTFTPDPDPEIGAMDNRFYYLGRASGGEERLFDYRSAYPEKNIAKNNPTLTQKLKERAHAYYETARYMLLNNTPLQPIATPSNAH